MSLKLTELNQKRMVYLYDQFHQETAEDITKKLIAMDAVSNEDIYLIINSYGGQVYSLMAMIDAINNLKSKVNTVCLGIGASCGAVLFSLGNKRYIGENSKLMFHQVSTMAWGTVDQIENDLKEAKELNDKLFNLVLGRSKLDNNGLADIFAKDSYITAASAIEKGFADEVIEVEKEVENEAYEMVKSFTGSFRDEAYLAIVASKFPVNVTKENTVRKEKKSMNLEEIKAEALKLGLDIDAITNAIGVKDAEISNLKAVVEEKEVKINVLAACNEKLLSDQKEEKLNSILDKLIDSGKSTQDYNVALKEMFADKAVEQIEKFCEKLPVLVKFNRKSEDTVDVPDASDKAGQLKSAVEEIKALAAQKNITFDQAADEYYTTK